MMSTPCRPINRPPPRGKSGVGSVVALRRYPVKSMMGEELNACEVTDRGLLGDRRFAVVADLPGRSGAAKNPRKSGNFFDFRAAYADAPKTGARISRSGSRSPDGTEVTSWQPDLEQILSGAFGWDVAFEEARPGQMPWGATAEEYWPDIAGLDYRDSVTDFQMPAGTFFDIAVVHLLTTATINRLRALYPDGRFEVRRFRPKHRRVDARRRCRLRGKRLDRPHRRDRRQPPPGHH
jgi:uncharacterized protein